MSSFKDFYSVDAANEGVKIPVLMPDKTKTGDYLIIRGAESDAFRKAIIKAEQRKLAIRSIEDEDARIEAALDSIRVATAALVKEWSFDEPCTQENVTEFFKNRPSMQDFVDMAAKDYSLFFGKRLSNSASTQKKKLNSTKSLKAQK